MNITEVVRYDRSNTVAVLVSADSGVGGIRRPVWVNKVAPVASTEDNLLEDGGFEAGAGGWGKSAMAPVTGEDDILGEMLDEPSAPSPNDSH